MKSIIKIIIRPKSSFLTPIRADIIFGQICWSILHNNGEEQLKLFLSYFKDAPFFLISDGFIDGYLPKPLIKIEKNKDIEKKLQSRKIDDAKKAKKIKLIKIEDFINICKGEVSTIDKLIIRDYNSFVNVEKESIRNNTKNKDDGLFSQKEFWTNTKYSFFIKIINKDLFNEFSIEKYIHQIFGTLGYGAGTSIGKGFFDIKIEDFTCFDDLKGDYKILLSHCVLNKEERNLLLDSRYKIELKYGKLGKNKSLSLNPFKNPLIQIIPGSIIKTEKEYVGEMLNLIESQKEVLDYNYGLLIPCSKNQYEIY